MQDEYRAEGQDEAEINQFISLRIAERGEDHAAGFKIPACYFTRAFDRAGTRYAHDGHARTPGRGRGGENRIGHYLPGESNIFRHMFIPASFIGAPQFVLIAACVVAFGPIEGFFYSWIATVISAAANFPSS